MRKGGGLTFWPKPMVQMEKGSSNLVRTIIAIKYCGFCDSVFELNDIAVTSCRHTYHPFCLGIMVKSSYKCRVCDEDLHPNWWTSWGFREIPEKLLQLAEDLKLEEERKATIAILYAVAKEGLDSLSGISIF
jgi:hypothetical protein